MATLATLQDRLTALNAAIAAIEGGPQHYSAGGLTVSRATLWHIYQERATIEARIARRDGSVPTYTRVQLGGAF